MSDHARDRILEAARALLQRQEDGRVLTIGEVAAAAHVSRATVYRYFADKSELLQAAGATNGRSLPALDPRTRILEAALDVFGERGVHAATLAEIASRAGLSLSGLHWHFKNKDELVAGLGEAIPVFTTLLEEADRAEHPAVDLGEQLTRIATAGCRFLEGRRSLIRLLIFESGIHPDVAQIARAYTIGRFFPIMVALFDQHARRGTLRPGSSRARAQAFFGMMVLLQLLRPAFDDLLDPDDEETVREHVQIMLHGILAAPTGGRS